MYTYLPDKDAVRIYALLMVKHRGFGDRRTGHTLNRTLDFFLTLALLVSMLTAAFPT